MNTRLKFAKPVGANVYQANIDDYSVEDPLLKQKKSGDLFGRDLAPGDVWREKSLGQTSKRWDGR
jgi:hypothetical protein